MDHGAAGDGATDDHAAVAAAIASLGGAPGVVYLPAGTYLLNSAVTLPAGVVLRGERPASTLLRFNLIGHCISVSAGQSASFQSIVSGYTIHSSTLAVADGSQFAAGDYAETREEDDPGWGTSTWADHVVGQIVKIASVTGNVLTLETPLRIGYTAGQNPEIRKITPVTEVGVENLKVERLLAGTAEERDNRYTISMTYAVRCWIRGVEGYNAFGAHVGLQACSHVEVTGCYLHHAHEYDGGGSGYGAKVQSKSGECLVENNIFRHLRHSMLLQVGANGNVFGYNYSLENYWDNPPNPTDITSDITCHGNYVYANLFEGNICQHIWSDDSHGLNGPLNTFFRNRAENRGINCSSSQTVGQNYAGNEAFRNTYLFGLWPGDGYSLRGSDNFEYGNNTESDGLELPGTGDLSDYSYYLGTDPGQAPPTPAFWNIADTIPTIGPPYSLNPAKNNPAYARYGAGGVMTVGLPSLASQPTNQVIDEGNTAAFSVTAVGTPVALYAWRKGGVDIPGETNASLTMANAQVADSGVYTVRVHDNGGSVVSAEAVLTVNAVTITAISSNGFHFAGVPRQESAWPINGPVSGRYGKLCRQPHIVGVRTQASPLPVAFPWLSSCSKLP